MPIKTSLFPTAFIFVFLSQAVFAETVYVRDTLYVPLRGGQTIEHRILHRGLKSGTKMELLETVEESGFSQIKMEDGVVGWIKTQYLTDQPIAADVLNSLVQEHSELEAEHQKSLLDQQTLRTDRDDLSLSLDDAVAKSVRLERELNDITALAADVISINQENERLINERESLNAEIEELENTSKSLQDGENRNWFLLGAGVVFGGLLIGFWIARQLYNRRGNTGWA